MACRATRFFSRDGKLVAVSALVRDEKQKVTGAVIALFEVASGDKLWQTTEIEFPRDIEFWPDGELAIGNRQNTWIFDARIGTIKRKLGGSYLAVAADGHSVLTTGSQGAPLTLGDWKGMALTSLLKQDLEKPTADGKRVGVESKGGFAFGSVDAGALSADGSRLVAAGTYGAKLFNGNNGDFLATFSENGQAPRFDFSRDSTRLLLRSSFGARLVDATNGDVLADWKFPQPNADTKSGGAVAELADDGKTLVVAVSASPTARAIYAYDLTQAAAPQALAPNRVQIPVPGNALAIAPDGKTLASAGQVLFFVSAADGKRLRSPGGADVMGSVVWSRDGKFLLTGGTALNSAQLWDAATFSVIQTLGQHEWPLDAVALSPDAKLAAAGGSGFTGATRPATRGLVSLFDTASGKTLKTLVAMTGRATALEFSPDGHWLATGADDGTLDIWDVAATLASPDPDGGQPALHIGRDGKILESQSSVFGLAWRGGELFVAQRGTEFGDNAAVSVLSWRDGAGRDGAARVLRTFPLAEGAQRSGKSFALSADARRFALSESAGYQKPETIYVRDATTGKILAKLPVEGEVLSLVFAPDGQTLYFQMRAPDNKNTLQKWMLP